MIRTRLPLDPADYCTWAHTLSRCAPQWFKNPNQRWLETAIHQDSRDAELMRWLLDTRQRHYRLSPRLPTEPELPIVHVLLRLNPEWPMGRYGITF